MRSIPFVCICKFPFRRTPAQLKSLSTWSDPRVKCEASGDNKRRGGSKFPTVFKFKVM